MSTLTDDELNEKVAELSGHRRMFLLKKRGLYYRRDAQGYTACISEAGRFTKEEAEKHEYPHDEPVTSELEPLPNFANDLNAMHEAEKVPLSQSRIGDRNSQFARYIGNLEKICGTCKDIDDRTCVTVWESFAYATIASAKQRALALIQTMQPKTP